jgi:RimJ/RimL family protein N-acetyltransferase
MDIAMISMGLHRIQLTVRTTDKRAEKWAYAIGFKRDGVLRKYGVDGVDYLMMSRIK